MCKNPELPVFDGSVVPSSAPVRCYNCGAELFLACGPDSEAPAKQQREYSPKPCGKCLRTFTPSGPRSVFCKRGDCDQVASALTSKIPRPAQ